MSKDDIFDFELQLFSKELCRHLTPSLLEKCPKGLGFVKRKRKFSGNKLVTIVFGIVNLQQVILLFDYVANYT